MAKELLLVRHGLTEAPSFEKNDLERNLTVPGIDQLNRLSNVLKINDQKCDYLVHSPANRCKQTAKIMADRLEIHSSKMIDNIYQADQHMLYRIICGFRSEASNAILVGHNPGVSYFASYLTGEDLLLFSPGMMVRIRFFVDEWQHISQGSGALEEILQ